MYAVAEALTRFRGNKAASVNSSWRVDRAFVKKQEQTKKEKT
jgi:hypothetical protein